MDLDPFLTNKTGTKLPLYEQLLHLCTFASFVRQGGAGRGHQVRAQNVQAALAAIAKTFTLAGLPSPVHCDLANKTYHNSLKEQMEGYKAEDPKSTPQIAVPVKLTVHLLEAATAIQYQTNTSSYKKTHTSATADLICIAFYYLLRVGEYTKPDKSRGKTRTVPFQLKNITFRNHKGHIIPHTAPLATLLQATEATLQLINQKNSVKGQLIHHETTSTPHCPVKALARRVHHILHHGGSGHSFLYTFYNGLVPHHIKATHITNAIRSGADAIGLFKPEIGYAPSDVSSHSLRAGGAMAMHLHGVDTITIQKMGRWKSVTFLNYIHEQISAFAAGLSKIMAKNVQFRQIAGPTIRAPGNHPSITSP